LEVIAIFVRLQQSYMKFCCLLCEWDSLEKNFPLQKEGLVFTAAGNKEFTAPTAG
jgi:hypothetical protein